MKVILVGGFSEIIELCEANEYEIIGIIDKTTERKIFGYDVIGNDQDARKIFKKFSAVPLIVSPDMPSLRRRLVTYYRDIGFSFQSLISQKAMISKYASIGKGAMIHDGANISAMVQLGDHVRLNVYANIMHDCSIGSFSSIAPNSVLLGHVIVMEEVYIGANATILPGKVINGKAIVGAGAVVTRNVDQGSTVKGVPAK